MSKKEVTSTHKDSSVIPADGDLRKLLYFENGVMCINNKSEVIRDSNHNSIVFQCISSSWPLLFCIVSFFLLDWVMCDAYSHLTKVCMSCCLGLAAIEVASNMRMRSNQCDKPITKKKSFVNDEEKMSEVDVADCLVEIRYVKLIKKKWKFKICISIEKLNQQWHEWRSFEEVLSLQCQLLRYFDNGSHPDLTPNCKNALKCPFDVEDDSHWVVGEKKSMEELNAELRNKQVSNT